MARTPKQYTCARCGKLFMADWKNPKYCSRGCLGKATIGKAGAESRWWKGGRSVKPGTYVKAWTGPNEVRSEHRVIAERALGHALPPRAVIHHWDEDKTNNDPRNLVICEDTAYHALLHARKRRLDDTGSLELKRCEVCGTVKALVEFGAAAEEWDRKRRACRACDRARNLAYYYKARAQGKAWALRHK